MSPVTNESRFWAVGGSANAWTIARLRGVVTFTRRWAVLMMYLQSQVTVYFTWWHVCGGVLCRLLPVYNSGKRHVFWRKLAARNGRFAEDSFCFSRNLICSTLILTHLTFLIFVRFLKYLLSSRDSYNVKLLYSHFWSTRDLVDSIDCFLYSCQKIIRFYT